MKRNILKVLSLLWILPVVSCNEGVWEPVSFSDLTVNIDNSDDEVLIFKSTSNQTAPTFDINVKKAGVIITSQEDCSSSVSFNLPVGNGYTIEATSGENMDAAFDSPFYRGVSDSFDLPKNDGEAVSVACSLANVKVTVYFSDEIKARFSSYILTVTNADYEAGKYLTFNSSDETINKAGYFKVTEAATLKWKLSLISTDGSVYNDLTGTFTNVQARQHYNMQFQTATYTDDKGASYVRVECDTQLSEVDNNIDVEFGLVPSISGSQKTGSTTEALDLNQSIQQTEGAQTTITVSASDSYACTEILVTANGTTTDILEANIEGITRNTLTSTEVGKKLEEIDITEYINGLTTGTTHTLIIEARNTNGIFVQPITIQK